MILSKASVVRSPSRFGAWLRHLAAALAVVAFASGTASAQFCEISTNSPYDVSSQLIYILTQVDDDTIQIRYENTGPIASSITGIWIDDNGAFLDPPPTIVDSSGGVEFETSTSQPNLPGGNSISFAAAAGLSVSSDSPTQPNGINPSEWLEVQYELKDGVTFAQFQTALTTGVVNIGLHVQGLPDGKSEGYVTCVPEPASVVMLGMSSIVGVGYAWRRRKRGVA